MHAASKPLQGHQLRTLCTYVLRLQLARATDFYERQEQYKQQRRSRILARQQRLAQLEQKAAQQQQHQQEAQAQPAKEQLQSEPLTGAQQGAQPAAWIADADSSGPGITTEPSGSSIASIDGQPLRVVVHFGSSGSNDGAEAAAGSSCIAGDATRGGSGGGSLSSITTDEDTCGICFDNNNHVAIKYCGHRLCVDCYRKVWELSGGDSTCPFCRARLEGYMYLDSLDLLLPQ